MTPTSIWHKHSDDLRKEIVERVIEKHHVKQIERLKTNSNGKNRK
ncbi:MAG: hypothetical protein JWQ09_4401 [Segetibacter sp.]|nr:hypothetical protein [Segetibacter sp.]